MADTRDSSTEAFLDLLYARVPEVRFTQALVLVNVLVFLFMAWHAGSLWRIPGATLADFGGNYAVQTRHGESWRLVSSLFLHGGLLHVGLNMIALYQAGALAERLFGLRRFVLLYFLCGVVASVASIWWRPNGLSVGASGAIFGVFGGLLSSVLVTRHVLPDDLYRRLRRALITFIGYSLAAGFLIPGVDNAAHLGGLLAGLILGGALAFPPGREDVAVGRILLGVFCSTALAAGLWATVPQKASVPLSNGAFAAMAQHLSAQEELLVNRYNLLMDALRHGRISDAKAIGLIEDELIPAWKQLEGEVAAGGQGDWRTPALLKYLAKRRDALQVMVIALRTHELKWLNLANALQAKADEFLLEYRMMLDGGAPVRP